MTDVAEQFRAIERTLIDYFEMSGHEVEHVGSAWIENVGGKEVPLTAIAIAIFAALKP